MQLESFLTTIGPENVAFLRSLKIHVPLWYQTVQERFLERALLNITFVTQDRGGRRERDNIRKDRMTACALSLEHRDLDFHDQMFPIPRSWF